MTESFYVHPSAELAPSVEVGPGTKIWHLAQVRAGVRIGANCVLGRDVYIDEHVRIGNNVKIQNRASIYRECVLEDGVFVGPHVCFTNDRYPRAINPDDTLKTADDWSAGSTWVGKGASIGAGAIILPSMHIGRYAMVGAGAIVAHDVPDHVLVTGNPARAIGCVCVCGVRLVEDAELKRCQACGRVYRVADSGEIVSTIAGTIALHEGSEP